jgi:iron-sulfur cluster repair protein YtfE (RIC family)
MDAVTRLEHDHQHLNRLVDSMREAFQDALRGDRDPAEVLDECEEFLRMVNEELFSHFEREETVLFPWVVELLEDTAPAVAAMETAHDRICGVSSRMEYLLGQGRESALSSFDMLVGLFARFDANYSRHSQDEAAFLKSLGTRLDATQRATLGGLLEQL